MSLGRWAPNTYCHFHKHLGNTTSLVLEGEHHTVETLGGESIHKVRQAGDHAQKPGGEILVGNAERPADKAHAFSHLHHQRSILQSGHGAGATGVDITE